MDDGKTMVGQWPVMLGRIDDYLRAWDGQPHKNKPAMVVFMRWLRDRVEDDGAEEPADAPWVVSPRKPGTAYRPGRYKPSDGMPDPIAHRPVCEHSTNPVKGCDPCHGEEDTVVDAARAMNPPEPPGDWEDPDTTPDPSHLISQGELLAHAVRSQLNNDLREKVAPTVREEEEPDDFMGMFQ